MGTNLVNSNHQGIVHDIVSLQEQCVIKDSSPQKLLGVLENVSMMIQLK